MRCVALLLWLELDGRPACWWDGWAMSFVDEKEKVVVEGAANFIGDRCRRSGE